MTLTPERRAEIERFITRYPGSWEDGAMRELLAALAEAERERDYWRERAIDRWEEAQRREIAEREAEGEYRCAKCGMPEVCDDADCPGREAEGE